ncbi:MAG: GAF domain-containing protein, partial [Candidatus Methylomirabilia bacterium]
AQQAARACEMDRCSIFLLEEERVVPITSRYADGRVDQALGEAFQGLGRMRVQEIPFLAETVSRREPVVIDRAAKDPLVPRAMEVLRLKAVLALPLVRPGKPVLGALVLDNPKARSPVTAAQVARGATVASQVALAVDSARLSEQAERALAEVRAIQDRLAQSEELRALGEMAGGVAHDFNNLLTAILGRAQFLLFQLEEGEVPPKETQRNLTVIEQAAMDGAQTVRRLLDSSRSVRTRQTA